MNCRDLRKRRIFKGVSGGIKSKIKKILSVKTKALNYNIFTVAYYIFTIQNTINYLYGRKNFIVLADIYVQTRKKLIFSS